MFPWLTGLSLKEEEGQMVQLCALPWGWGQGTPMQPAQQLGHKLRPPREGHPEGAGPWGPG